jgi:VIT1/CCC1 family predicted Fe2+/Mn2+ transporter
MQHVSFDEQSIQQARRYCADELFDSEVYRRLAEIEKNDAHRNILLEFSAQEKGHYEFWRSIGGECVDEVKLWRTRLFVLMRRLLGLTFTLKFLERHEKSVTESYREFLGKISDEKLRKSLQKIIEDEEIHEKTHMQGINEKFVSYVGFIALGLADAIVEITGVHAGFLGVTSSTLITGIAGLIVGISAAISMASAAYVQSKHELRTNPLTSALYTGLAYIIAVVLLATPYFVFKSMINAFAISIIIGILMVLGFTFYGSVLQDKGFRREFLETTSLLFATAIATYFIGEVIGGYFGIRGIFG